jgi:hypothetical protein
MVWSLLFSSKSLKGKAIGMSLCGPVGLLKRVGVIGHDKVI